MAQRKKRRIQPEDKQPEKPIKKRQESNVVKPVSKIVDTQLAFFPQAVSSFFITDYPVKHKHNQYPDEGEDFQLEKLLHGKELEEQITILEKYIKEYPFIGLAYHLLFELYHEEGEEYIKKRDEIAVKNYRKNPSYLYALTDYAKVCIEDGYFHKIPSIFKEQFNLATVVKPRKRFEIEEVQAFYICMVEYFVSIEEHDKALEYADFMALNELEEDLIERMNDALDDIPEDSEATKEGGGCLPLLFLLAIVGGIIGFIWLIIRFIW